MTCYEMLWWHEIISASLKLFSRKALKKHKEKKTLSVLKIHTYMTPGLAEGLPWWLRRKRLSAMRETWVRFLGREDPLGKEMAIHSSTLARKIPWTEEPDRLHPMESQSRTQLSDFTSLHFSGVREWLYCKADWASCFSLRLTGAIPAFLCSAFSVSSNDPSYIFPTLSVPVQMTSQQPLDCQQAYYAQSPYSRMYLP